MTGKKIQTSPTGSPSSSTRDQESFLPIANVSRIMKRSLPANAKVSKEAKETVQECVSEFISFITGEASDKCQREKRKTINGDDLLWAMTTLGFENYVGPLKVYLNKYREIEGEKNSMAIQEDKSFPNTIAMNEVNLDGPSSMSNRQDFQSFNGFYELEAGKSYGEDLVSGGFGTRKIHELGDGSAKRVPTHLPLEYW